MVSVDQILGNEANESALLFIVTLRLEIEGQERSGNLLRVGRYVISVPPIHGLALPLLPQEEGGRADKQIRTLNLIYLK